MRSKWTIGGMVCLVAVLSQVAWAQDPRQEGNRPPKQKRNRAGQFESADGVGQAAGGQGQFDIAAFSQHMLQQFDQDQNGALDQQELLNCLTALHQQVEQQNHAIADAARQQAFMEMAGGGGPGGLAGQGFPGGGSQSTDSQSNSDQQSSSAFAEFSANSVNGRGQVRGRKETTGKGQADGGGRIGGGTRESAGSSRSGGGGRR
jgi:hypothetical protein